MGVSFFLGCPAPLATIAAMSADDFLSFPPETLVREPLRLPIVARGSEWLVLAKPPGVP